MNNLKISKQYPIPKEYTGARNNSTKAQVLHKMGQMVKGDSILVTVNNSGWYTKDHTEGNYYGPKPKRYKYDSINMNTVNIWLREWHLNNGCKITYQSRSYLGGPVTKTKTKVDPAQVRFICDGCKGHIRIWKVK